MSWLCGLMSQIKTRKRVEKKNGDKKSFKLWKNTLLVEARYNLEDICWRFYVISPFQCGFSLVELEN